MGGGRVAHPVLKGPSVVKELVIGAVLGLAAGGLWKMHHWNEQRKTRAFYDLLEKGEISVVSSNLSVKLYDDCDKLLDSKIVKLDVAVRSGETLTFGAYLVDIGDPHGETKPIPNPILQRDKTMVDRKSTPSNKTSMGSLHIRKASSTNLSPSQKVIREFKRRELKVYCSSPSRPDTVKDDSTEWQVLYTTQLTQKAKKFHDGILKVANSGLRGRQAVLYDETRRLLDSRFLKNEEIINAGESMRFDGHIVDIIELKDDKPLKNTNVDESNCYKQNTVQSSIQTNMKEWDVMYTTQVTQKAKKFHDGVLKLAISGSQGRQEATLLAEDGTVLSHRYLKLSEDINSGNSFNMTNYLVEVCEPRKHSVEKCPRKVSASENETPETKQFDVDNIKLCKRIPATRPLSDVKPPKRSFLLQDTETTVRKSVANEVISTTISKNKPLRDAHSILSILKKPSTQEGPSVEKVHLEAQQDSCSSRSEKAICNQETRVSSEAISTSNFNEVAKETKDQSNTEISGDNKMVDSRNIDCPSFDLGID
ncbi:hypothetical protein L1987_26066 [Smallanthus sonchifolius]|uniref:Uncharacterized protein n=1 Tax=Smallanthus sonchifolius TaxID=185202 RepID=A0ACB9IAG1_9ASTR|nr:hypothetical protein L1987_26066 [Smallanthus sonchifolius]